MNLDGIVLEMLDGLAQNKEVDIEKYCNTYPAYRDQILAKFKTAEFIKQNFQEQDLSDKKIGDYIILQELGRGGMGIVFLAIHPVLSRLTAIKILPPSFSADKETFIKFQEEAKIIAKFNHPNIVPIYSFNNEQGIYYIAMGYIAGLSLKDTLESIKNRKASALKAMHIKEILTAPASDEENTSQKSISLKRGFEFWNKSYFYFIVKIFAEIAEALHYAHQNGIYHGDIKPSNILLTSEAIPMILDFGLAQDTKKLSKVSRREEFTGTLIYAAPEQIKGNIINDKTDIWSMGVSLYESLTFHNPFQAPLITKTIENILKANLPPLKSYDKKIPIELEVIVLKCLEANPQNRYHSIDELSCDLINYLESKPIRAQSIKKLARIRKYIQRNPRISYLGLLIALLIPLSLFISFKYSLKKMERTADFLLDEGYYNEAIQQYSKILKFSPFDVSILQGIGDAYYWEGEYDMALIYYERALKVNPNHQMIIKSIGDIYSDRKMHDKALENYLKALSLSPHDRYYWIAVADTYKEQKEFDKAAYHYGKAILLVPKAADTVEELSSLITDEKKLSNYEEVKEYLKSVGLSEQETSSLTLILKISPPSPLPNNE